MQSIFNYTFNVYASNDVAKQPAAVLGCIGLDITHL